SRQLLVLHGLFGMARNWRSVANLSARNHSPIICRADLRNHGDSPHSSGYEHGGYGWRCQASLLSSSWMPTPVHLLWPQLGRQVAMRTALLHRAAGAVANCLWTPRRSPAAPSRAGFASIMELMLSLDLSRPPDPPKDASIQRLFPRSENCIRGGPAPLGARDRPVEFCSKVTQFLRNCLRLRSARAELPLLLLRRRLLPPHVAAAGSHWPAPPLLAMLNGADGGWVRFGLLRASSVALEAESSPPWCYAGKMREATTASVNRRDSRPARCVTSRPRTRLGCHGQPSDGAHSVAGAAPAETRGWRAVAARSWRGTAAMSIQHRNRRESPPGAAGSPDVWQKIVDVLAQHERDVGHGRERSCIAKVLIAAVRRPRAR
uniref:AB hydrolase-1 domain-containing protein n=1 Tax=Macrostomum lignano TaxID=282301 RepID=A0A1I8FJF3_9PLAT